MSFPNFVLKTGSQCGSSKITYATFKVKNNYILGTAKVSNLYLKLKTTVDYRDLPIELQSNIYPKVSRTESRLINYFKINFEYLTSDFDNALGSFAIYMYWVDMTISKEYLTHYFYL